MFKGRVPNDAPPLRWRIGWRSASFDRADDEQQEDGAYGGHHELADQAVCRQSQQTENPTAQDRSHDSDDEVHQDTHAGTLHDFPREKAGEDADDNLPN